MAFAKNIMLGGFSGASADAINGQVASVSATPAGTQATALLVSADYNFVTFTSGSCAVRLYMGQPGDSCVITNAGTSAMFVFPPTGFLILGTATNAAVTVGINLSTRFTCVSTTQWINETSAQAGIA
jgi:hypothetical protein